MKYVYAVTESYNDEIIRIYEDEEAAIVFKEHMIEQQKNDEDGYDYYVEKWKVWPA
jgi:hypothetical protein